MIRRISIVTNGTSTETQGSLPLFVQFTQARFTIRLTFPQYLFIFLIFMALIFFAKLTNISQKKTIHFDSPLNDLPINGYVFRCTKCSTNYLANHIFILLFSENNIIFSQKKIRSSKLTDSICLN